MARRAHSRRWEGQSRPLPKLGSCRTVRLLEQDVNVAAIPVVTQPFRLLGPGEWSSLGDAPKDLVVFSGRRAFDQAYIAKKPRCEGPRECATEYLISCIGKMLPLRIAKARLVRLPVPPGAPSDVRHMSRFFLDLDAGEQIVHASQLAAKCFEMREEDLVREIPPQDRREWQFYSTTMVRDILAETDRGALPHLLDAFARMLAFDALVGANDRHPQNWGVVQNAKVRTPPRFAPIFDTARGLFWNWSDARLRAAEGRGERLSSIRRYADHSASLIGIDGARKQPSHFAVVEHVMLSGPDEFRRPIQQIVRAFSHRRFLAMLNRRFGRVFSPIRLAFVADLLRYRHGRLLSLVG